MTSFSLSTNFVENPKKLVRKVRPRVVPPHVTLTVEEPAIQVPTTDMAEKTLRDFFVPSATNIAT
jgi:hypothetical protein